MYNYAICDDNISFAKQLNEQIGQYFNSLNPPIDSSLIEICDSAESLLTLPDLGNLNVVFIDINMSGMSGFELAQRINNIYPETIIVFVSAYENLVYNSFDYSPIGFVRKNHLKEDLDMVLSRLVRRLEVNDATLTLIATIGEKPFHINEIVFIESIGNYYYIHTVDGEKTKCRGIVNTLENKFKNYNFCRVHAAFIVNMEKISSYNKVEIEMNTGEKVPISHTRRKHFRDCYMIFLRNRTSI